MKGTPTAPQCGFSLQVVRILNAQGAWLSTLPGVNRLRQLLLLTW
jgi:glutaredoxin-related protein